MLQIGGRVPGFARWGPAKEGAWKSIPFTESSLIVKIKNNWLILLSHFILNHFASMLYTAAKHP